MTILSKFRQVWAATLSQVKAMFSAWFLHTVIMDKITGATLVKLSSLYAFSYFSKWATAVDGGQYLRPCLPTLPALGKSAVGADVATFLEDEVAAAVGAELAAQAVGVHAG